MPIDRAGIEKLLNEYFFSGEKASQPEVQQSKLTTGKSTASPQNVSKIKALFSRFTKLAKASEQKKEVLMVAKVGITDKRQELVKRVPSNRFMAWLRGEKTDIAQIAQFCAKVGAQSFYFSKHLDALKASGQVVEGADKVKETRAEAIYDVIEKGDIEGVKALLDHWSKKQLEEPIKHEFTPLEWAVKKGQKDVAKLIFEKMEGYSREDNDTEDWLLDELPLKKAEPEKTLAFLEKVSPHFISTLHEDNQTTVAELLVKHKRADLALKFVDAFSTKCLQATMLPLKEKAISGGGEVTALVAKKFSHQLKPDDINYLFQERVSALLTDREFDPVASKKEIETLVSIALDPAISKNLTAEQLKSLIKLYLKTDPPKGDEKSYLYSLIKLLHEKEGAEKLASFIKSLDAAGTRILFDSINTLFMKAFYGTVNIGLIIGIIHAIPDKLKNNPDVVAACRQVREFAETMDHTDGTRNARVISEALGANGIPT